MICRMLSYFWSDNCYKVWILIQDFKQCFLNFHNATLCLKYFLLRTWLIKIAILPFSCGVSVVFRFTNISLKNRVLRIPLKTSPSQVSQSKHYFWFGISKLNFYWNETFWSPLNLEIMVLAVGLSCVCECLLSI